MEGGGHLGCLYGKRVVDCVNVTGYWRGAGILDACEATRITYRMKSPGNGGARSSWTPVQKEGHVPYEVIG